jgi:chemotaxis protein methyltransferase CheR
MSELTLSPQVFAILAGLVEQRAGLHYRPEDREIFADKVSSRAVEAGFDSLLDYYYLLRYDDPTGAELDLLIQALIVHETYFFRELEPVIVALDQIVMPRVRAGERARIWSAACSTGEEPYSIAMLLSDRGALDRVEIVASDIGSKALAKAREGRYRSRSLRGDGPVHADRFIERQGDDLVVPRRIVDAVEFRRVNLCAPADVAAMGTFDLVLCRNVLIYFAEPMIARVAAHLADRLRPGGALLVGVSESLLRFSTELACEEHRGVFLYRKGPGP